MDQSDPSKRVFVVGAGVSRTCNIPVARDLLGELAWFLKKRQRKIYRELQDLLSYLYPSYKEKYRNYPNIEDFLGLVEMAQRFNTEDYINSSYWSVSRLEKFEDGLKRGLSTFLWELSQDLSEPLTDFVRDIVAAGDTIICFNWDLTLEHAFICQSIRYSYIYPSNGGSRPCLLKPHGSIDWLMKKKVKNSDELTKNDYFYLSHNDRNIVVVRYFIRSIKKLASVTPVLVPPSPFKELRLQSQFAEFQGTWRSVFRAMRNATEILFLGYSMPRVDQFARFVFRRAIRLNINKARRREKKPVRITVVNPDEAVQLTFSRIVGNQPKMEFIQTYFEDWVGNLIK